jgi:hypothetical protein
MCEFLRSSSLNGSDWPLLWALHPHYSTLPTSHNFQSPLHTFALTVIMSNDDNSSIESDYAFIVKPRQDELQDDEDFTIAEKGAGRPQVDQGHHGLEVLPHS